MKYLTSVMTNTCNRMKLNRIRPVLDSLLIHNQHGFRQKRSTVGQILAIRRILKGITNKNILTVLTFIDFKKAFYSNIEVRWLKYLDHMEYLISFLMK